MKLFNCIILFAIASSSLFAQYDEIDGVINTYYKVTGLTTTYAQIDPGANLSTLKGGDKVVLIQMTGWDPTWNGEGSLHGDGGFSNTGQYELLAVDVVDDGLDRVFFTVDLELSKYDLGEKIQLVKIYEADYTEVTGKVSAAEWDGDRGGVIAMVIFKKLVLSADIDASNQGFLGGLPDPNFSGVCRNIPAPGDDLYFLDGAVSTAGNKGEGNITITQSPYNNNYSKGPGYLVNGGGGGLGYFAGGGGGSHYGAGGYGGSQKLGCIDDYNAFGGIEISRSTNFYGYDQVTMGGGGGSSTEDATYPATKGGDGGGIVIILADTLQGNGYSIMSNGQSVDTIAEAGGGGGGGGGAVLLDVNVYNGSVDVSVNGGNGGNTGSQVTGAGGGGGGGVLWYAGQTLATEVSYDVSGGSNGESQDETLNGGPGSPGGILDTLRLPLNGFLFNSLVGIDTICAGQVPDIIRGSMPKGGVSAYSYTWLQSTDSIVWSVIAGADDSLFYVPPVLSQTTYFSRVVESGLVSDTARPIKIFVYNAISGNSLAIRDTLCYNESPGVLTVGPLSGGDGDYKYSWETRTEAANWVESGITQNLSEDNLIVDTYYRRIVISASVCIDTSNVDTLTVLKNLSGNTFTISDTAVCYGSSADTIRIERPASGDITSFSYQWLESDGISSYSPIALNANSQNYYPGIVNDTVYYMREVRFGPGNACVDTSNEFALVVYPLISNNFIDGDAEQYNCYKTSIELNGIDNLGGGSGEGFKYTWQESSEKVNWNDAAGTNSSASYLSPELDTTIYFRRIVTSGSHDQCLDISDTVSIYLYPLISGNVIKDTVSSCALGTISIAYENLMGDSPFSISLGVGSTSYTETDITTSSGSIDFPVEISGEVRIQNIIDVHGCEADLVDNTGAIELTVYEWPVAFAGEDANTCGTVFTLEAEQTGEAGYWTGPGIFSDSTSSTTQVTVEEFSASINHIFQWKEWNWQCPDSSEVEIVFWELPEKPDLPEGPLLDYQFSYELEAPVPLGEGAWKQISGPDGGTATFEDSLSNTTTVYFTDFIAGEYTLQWTVTNGSCPSVDSVITIVIGEVSFYTGFSPNDDNINDEYIINLSGKAEAEFKIFDRWGNLIITLKDTDQIRWDGYNDNGTKMPEGTYFYLFSQDGLDKVEKGYIELRR